MRLGFFLGGAGVEGGMCAVGGGVGQYDVHFYQDSKLERERHRFTSNDTSFEKFIKTFHHQKYCDSVEIKYIMPLVVFNDAITLPDKSGFHFFFVSNTSAIRHFESFHHARSGHPVSPRMRGAPPGPEKA